MQSDMATVLLKRSYLNLAYLRGGRGDGGPLPLGEDSPAERGGGEACKVSHGSGGNGSVRVEDEVEAMEAASAATRKAGKTGVSGLTI